MKYAFSIDWLSLWCKCLDGQFNECPYEREVQDWEVWTYKKYDHGTRQFKELRDVILKGEVVAVVASKECNTTIGVGVCLVKFDNRLLYRNDLWQVVGAFLNDHNLAPLNITRLDLCADFNTFANGYDCRKFIEDFANGTIRHKGRGNGDMHFNHYAKRDAAGNSVAVLDYTGLSFGSHDSDARAYLYNKTYELRTIKDKPYIKELWHKAGLDIDKDVWRLEISIKSKGLKFKDKISGEQIEVKERTLRDMPEVLKVYHSFVRKLFFFLKNRTGITNISREPMITLFEKSPYYERGVIRPLSCSSRTEKILIKQLWQASQRYRGEEMENSEFQARELAYKVAESTGLTDWLLQRADEWKEPVKK